MTVVSLASPAQHTERFGLLRRLESRLPVEIDRLLEKAPRCSELVSLTLRTPELDDVDISGLSPTDLYWAQPGSRQLRVGFGQARVWRAQGPQRLALLDQELEALKRHWVISDPDGLQLEPHAFIGLAFDPEAELEGIWNGVPNALMSISELLLTRSEGNSCLTFTLAWKQDIPRDVLQAHWSQLATSSLSRLLEPVDRSRRTCKPCLAPTLADADSRTAWRRRVQKALNAIACGDFQKLVLTRHLRVRSATPIHTGPMLRWLHSHYPDCVHFAIPLGSKTLLGVTPERLVSLRHGSAVTDAIAGTLATEPNSGNHPSGRLYDDLKLRREQRLVVTEILKALQPVVRRLTLPEQPSVLALPHMQHLRSTIHAQVPDHTRLLDLAKRLHPTPAVGGAPTDRALAWLRDQGESWRGWYTGALGWGSPTGQGELAVALRCALIDGDEVTLFAGAGIVDGSDPEQEFLETQWKLQSMLEALRHA